MKVLSLAHCHQVTGAGGVEGYQELFNTLMSFEGLTQREISLAFAAFGVGFALASATSMTTKIVAGGLVASAQVYHLYPTAVTQS